MKILVSACLLGENCKYDGGNNYSREIEDYLRGHEVIPICPEVMGGLSIPRAPAEIVDGTVKTQNGTSVDRQFRKGAETALKIARREHAEAAVLQSRSPSCGVKQVYDGTFSGTLADGMGVTAKLLSDNGIELIDIEDIGLHKI